MWRRTEAFVLLLPILVVLLGLQLTPRPTETSRLLAAIDRQPMPRYPALAPPVQLPGEIRLSRIELPTTAPSLDLKGELLLPPIRLAAAAPDFALPGEIRLSALEFPRTAPVIGPPPAESGAAANPAAASPSANPMFARAGSSQCVPAQSPPAREAPLAHDAGRRLAAAAAAQVGDVVIYRAHYQRIAFPGGDVSPFYGVCTDVVVRAYRAIGIDLQHLVQAARTRPGGDANIDHRRVEVMRAFFERAGAALQPTLDTENYLPGDIVTYHRPQNRSSTSHIAIVTDIIAPSGRPMIAHNRGWGVQLEDALFVDRITGHYRYLPEGSMPQLLAAFSAGRRGTARDAAVRSLAQTSASGVRTAAIPVSVQPR